MKTQEPMDSDLEAKVEALRIKYKQTPDLRGVILKQVQLLKVAQEIRNKRAGNYQTKI